MNEKTFELMQSRGELLARIAVQREQMTEIGTHWRTPLALARPRSGCRAFFALPSFAGRRGRGFFRDSPSRRGWFGEGGVAGVERIPLFHFLFGKVVVARLNSFGNL